MTLIRIGLKMNNPCLVSDPVSVIRSEYYDHRITHGLVHATKDWMVDHCLRSPRKLVQVIQDLKSEIPGFDLRLKFVNPRIGAVFLEWWCG